MVKYWPRGKYFGIKPTATGLGRDNDTSEVGVAVGLTQLSIMYRGLRTTRVC